MKRLSAGAAGFGFKPSRENKRSMYRAYHRSCRRCDAAGGRVRFLAIVPDPDNRFPCASQGQVGLQEGWNLAKQVRDATEADENGEKRAIIAIVDVPARPTAGARSCSAFFWRQRRQPMLTSPPDWRDIP